MILILRVGQIFDKLKKGVDPKLQEEKTKRANERELAQFEKAQHRLGELARCYFLLRYIYKEFGNVSNLSANVIARFKTTLHYLLRYHRYVSSMQETLGKVFLNVSSIRSSVPIKAALIL